MGGLQPQTLAQSARAARAESELRFLVVTAVILFTADYLQAVEQVAELPTGNHQRVQQVAVEQVRVPLVQLVTVGVMAQMVIFMAMQEQVDQLV
jgi:hypothetical protein